VAKVEPLLFFKRNLAPQTVLKIKVYMTSLSRLGRKPWKHVA